MHSRAQLLVLRRALRRGIDAGATPRDIDRLCLECGVPIESFGIDLRAPDAPDRLESLLDDLRWYAAIAPEESD